MKDDRTAQKELTREEVDYLRNDAKALNTLKDISREKPIISASGKPIMDCSVIDFSR